MTRRVRHRLHGNPFNVRGEIEVPVWSEVYGGRDAPFALDVGFGGGDFTLGLARQHPEWNVLGLEIRQHLVDGLIEEARAEGLTNVFAVLANANIHLESLVPDRSVAFVAVNFPDPWYKKRHHKRRVVRTEWLGVLGHKLRPGAELHVATDYEPIAVEIRDLVESTAGFENQIGPGAFAPESTTGIQTERERSHTRRGEPIHRLWYRFHPPPAKTVVENANRR